MWNLQFPWRVARTTSRYAFFVVALILLGRAYALDSNHSDNALELESSFSFTAAMRHIANTVSTASEIISLAPDLQSFNDQLDHELSVFEPQTPDVMPEHVAIILDGNRRWATQRGYSDRAYGQCFGAVRLKQITAAAEYLGLKQLTVYLFSAKNWRRTDHEVGIIMSTLTSAATYWKPGLVSTNVQIRHIGTKQNLNAEVAKALEYAVESTKDNTGMKLNLVFDYDPAQDGLQAAIALAASQYPENQLTPDVFSSLLYSGRLEGWSSPDLLIRTGGEMRLSGFIPFQLSHSELYFLDMYWPDFTPDALAKAVSIYSERNRRFGK